MRAISGMHPRFDRWSSVALPAVVGALGLFLAACQGDAPTGVPGGSGSDVITPFTIVPGAGTAVALSTNRVVHTSTTLYGQSPTPGHAMASTRGTLVNSPWDLTNFGGPVITSATSRNVYVNCPTTPANCWGTVTLTPATFLRDLNVSNLIAIANQYLSEDAAGKFGVTEMKTTAKFVNHTASMKDIFSIVFSASEAAHASGYHNIFHVFLPQGTDMCMDATHCYSPDKPSTFIFCAFHGSVDFGAKHVIFTVEPFQFVGGCVLPNQTRVIDGTASTLSHEFIETITDPDGDAWFSGLTSNEIGDLCFVFRNSQVVGTRAYTVQEEYSNTIHNCTSGAF